MSTCPALAETLYHVKSQMFGVTTVILANGSMVHMYTGERYQTMDSFGARRFASCLLGALLQCDCIREAAWSQHLLTRRGRDHGR